MGNFKKTIDLGGMTVSIEVKENTPNRSCGCSAPWQRPVAQPRCAVPTHGGEGLMVAVQKPQPQFYENSWRGNATYREHLRSYENLERAAAACNWPNDLIDSGAIKWPVPQKNVVTREPQRSWNTPCGCTATASRYSYPTPQPQREVRQKCGIPPIGAKVVAHRWGEPVFDR